jgi:hypothetical protein
MPIQVKDATGATITVPTLEDVDFATQATAAAILAKLSADPATQATLAAVLARLQATLAVSGPLTDVQLRAAAIAISAAALPLPAGAATEATLSALNALLAGGLDVAVANFPVSQAVTGPLTDAQLRAAAVPVSAAALPLPTGAAAEATLQAVRDRLPAAPHAQPLTDAQLRAAAVPVSAAALPLPAGASTETTLAAVVTALGQILTELGAKTEPADAQAVSAVALPLPTGAATAAGVAEVRDRLPAVAHTQPLTDTQLRATAVPVTGTFIKAEDSPAASGDPGIPLLAMRQIADTTSTDADGDYTLLKIDEEGRLKVATKPASFDLVSGNITANAQTVFCDVRRASNVQAMMNTSSLSGHNVTFEGSIDSTTGTDGVWFGIQAVRSNANTIETATGALAATPAYAWEMSVNGLAFVRVRATAHTSGTATWKFQRGSYATEPIPAAQVSGTQPVSGTVTANQGTFTAPTASNINSAASTNLTSVKASAGTVYNMAIFNGGAGAAYVKLYNKASAPAPATDTPVLVIPVAAGAMIAVNFGVTGHRFGTGIALSITGAVGDTDTTAVAAGQVKVATAYI